MSEKKCTRISNNTYFYFEKFSDFWIKNQKYHYVIEII